jgi:hypothetical protein
MTITFENNNNIIVYALERIISYTRRTQQVFVPQCVWWPVSIIRSEHGLINHTDNLHGRTFISTELHSEGVGNHTVPDSSIIQDSKPKRLKGNHQFTILKEYQELQKESSQLRVVATLKSQRVNRTGRINPTPILKKALRKKGRSERKPAIPAQKESKTAGIDQAEIQRRKEADKYLWCAWPSDQEGAH